MSKTLKALCNCKHEFQDKQHGKGLRVCTPVRNKNALATPQGRCTVCLRVHDLKEVKK